MARNMTEDFDARNRLRDFLSALFAPQMRAEVVTAVVNDLGGVSWTPEQLTAMLVGIEDTGEKVKKIYYSILEEAGDKMNTQFRYFLKAIATAAGHLTELRQEITKEMTGQSQTPAEQMFATRIVNEGLINMSLFF